MYQHFLNLLNSLPQPLQLTLGITFGGLIVLLLSSIISFVILLSIASSLNKLAPNSKNTLQNARKTLKKPLTLTIFFLAAAAVSQLADNDLQPVLSVVASALAALALAVAAYRAVPLVTQALQDQNILSQSAKGWVAAAAQTAIAVLASLSILQICGVPVTAFVASLGVLGLAAALAGQEFLKNVIAGLGVLSERSFAVGDWISINSQTQGIVEHIGLRITTIRQFDQSPIYVPNSSMSEASLTNHSRTPHRRIAWIIALEYNTPPKTLHAFCSQLSQFFLNDPRFTKPPSPRTYSLISEFADSSINIRIQAFSLGPDYGKYIQLKHDLAIHIINLAESLNASFAFPSQSTYLHDLRNPNHEPKNVGNEPKNVGGDGVEPSTSPV